MNLANDEASRHRSIRIKTDHGVPYPVLPRAESVSTRDLLRRAADAIEESRRLVEHTQHVREVRALVNRGT